MNKILLASVAVLALTATTAQADQRHHYRQHHHSNGGNWAAPLIGGLLLGGIVGGLAAQSHQGPSCPYGTQPGRMAVYDEYGRFVGNRVVCVEY
jgi:heme A synthase